LVCACLPNSNESNQSDAHGAELAEAELIDYDVGGINFEIPASYLVKQTLYAGDTAYIRVLLPDLTPKTPETASLLERNDHHRRLIVLLKELPERALIKDQERWLKAVLGRRVRPDGEPYFLPPVSTGNGLQVHRNNAEPNGKAKQDVFVSRTDSGKVEFVLICDVPPHPKRHTNQSCEADVPFMNRVWVNITFTHQNLSNAKVIVKGVHSMIETFTNRRMEQ